MHGWETRMLLRHYLEQGLSKAELSRRFGVSRRTIHRWIESGRLDVEPSSSAARYTPRPRPPHKLDPYKELIAVRLEEFPKLSAKRVFDEVRALGYDGGYSRVRDHVRVVRPRAPEEPLVRFETPAGHQGQVDFGRFKLSWGIRHALLVVLGYSRLLWLRFYSRQTMPVLFEGLEAAFKRFGGVPRELLFDQMRPVVVSTTVLRAAAWWSTRSFCDSRPTGASCLAPASRIARRPRARWSVRSGTCGPASSTVGSSSTTRT